MRRRGDKTVSGKHAEEKHETNKVIKVRSWSRLKWVAIALAALYLATPFLLRRVFPGFLQHLVYSHAVTYFVDLSSPADLGLNHTVNMYLSSEEGVTLGVWHTVPAKKWKEAQGQGLDWYEKALGDGAPVFIYLHGNTGNRAAPHRIGIVNVLSSLGYHAVAMDYRGFGDSSGEPTEAGMTTDAVFLYHWVRDRSKGSPVIIWGHSLGTGVGTNSAVKIQEQGNPVDAVILEGAFNTEKNPVDKIPHPMNWYYYRFPYIHNYFMNSKKPEDNPFVMPTAKNLKKMTSPLLILHAKDDHLVPYQVAEEYYHIAKSAQKSSDRVKLVLFHESLGYLHNQIFRDPGLPGIIKEFMQSIKP